MLRCTLCRTRYCTVPYVLLCCAILLTVLCGKVLYCTGAIGCLVGHTQYSTAQECDIGWELFAVCIGLFCSIADVGRGGRRRRYDCRLPLW